MQLLVIFGPPAVGKMTVGRAVAERSGFRLVHNHVTIEPLLTVFDYGTPPFMRLLFEFRRRIVEEAAADGVDLLLTYVWALELESDRALLEEQVAIYADAGARVSFVELYADLPTRLARNGTELRLREKPSKRSADWSDDNVRQAEEHVLNTTPGLRTPAHELLERHRHLRLDNGELPPDEVAGQILDWLAGAQ